MNRFVCTFACVMCVVAVPMLSAQDKPEMPPATNPSTMPAPKPLSEQVFKGMAWLGQNQLANGAWGQGEESQHMGGGEALKSQPNVADTCMAVMALVRAGSTPKDGVYKENVLKAIAFVCSQIENSDDKSLYITDLRSTRTQQKLGTYIDSFLAAQMLAEMRKQMPDELTTKRVDAALDKVLKKIETNQKDNGQWANEGWAPTLAQAAAAKALNVAAQNGAQVDEKVREKAETYARADYQHEHSGQSAAGGAGVGIYTAGSQIAAMQSSSTTNGQLRKQYADVVDNAATKPAAEVAQAREQLRRFDANDKDLADAQAAVVAKMNDKQFMAGFGSNGGEEFLSYLNIGESLFAKGGDNWATWDKNITNNLNGIQNSDGSWTGHHCITGRTFCTSAALMVLTIDRASTPLAGKIQEPHK